MSRKWSHRDPDITVNGDVLHVDVAAWAEVPDHDFVNFITGPIDLSVGIPTGCTGGSAIAPGDNGFGTGYNIHFHTDTTLHTGTDSLGTFIQVAVVCTVPANLDTDGHDWRMQLTLTPDDATRSGSVKLFRSSVPSDEQVVRI